jgi:hypothetical protein
MLNRSNQHIFYFPFIFKGVVGVQLPKRLGVPENYLKAFSWIVAPTSCPRAKQNKKLLLIPLNRHIIEVKAKYYQG